METKQLGQTGTSGQLGLIATHSRAPLGAKPDLIHVRLSPWGSVRLGVTNCKGEGDPGLLSRHLLLLGLTPLILHSGNPEKS